MNRQARGFSLRGRLLVLLLSAMALLWTATAFMSYFAARHEVDELFDAHLAQSADVLMAQVESDISAVAGEAQEEEHHQYQQRLAFQVWGHNGNLLLRSASAPLTPLSEFASGYSDSTIEGSRWRVFSRWDREHEQQVQVAQSYQIREELAGVIGQRLLLPLLVGLPLLGVLIWVSVKRGLQPLHAISEQVQQRAAQNLAPIDYAQIPDEVRPLAGSLNDLLRRLQDAFEIERRFTADAAHELRTPLAALKTQAQVAMRAGDDEARRLALGQVVSSVDRATHLVQQLLTLSRIEAGVARIGEQQVDMAQVASDVVGEIAPQAVAKHVDIELVEGAQGVVRGDAVLLRTLLRNLVDNAVRYTPSGGSVTVTAHQEGDSVIVQVSDTGIGIAAEERERVFDRFYRVLGTNQPGSGLGLSIVKRIAEIHGAEVMLDSSASGKGLAVTVRFP